MAARPVTPAVFRPAAAAAAQPAAPLAGGPVWGRPLGWLALILLGPLLLLPTPLAPLALGWATLLALVIWGIGVAAVIGAMVGTTTPVLMHLERGVRRWAARFAPDPGALWIQWAREAHRSSQAHWCLEQAAGLGGAEALFQEGLAYLDGGFGAGGQIAGLERMVWSAQQGHPEAAFWFAEALRTGRGGRSDAEGALRWYQASAAAGFGPAAAWLTEAHARGDGVAVDPGQARHWAEVAERLAPHRPLSRSLLRHDAAPEDPLVQAGAGFLQSLEDLADRGLQHRAGRWALGVGAVLLAGLGLGTVVTFFLVGASGLFFLPLLMLAPPGIMLAWLAWQLRRDRPRQGRDRLREAAEAGDPEACFRLGMAYRKGTPSMPPDDSCAALWFRRAAEAGHREAMGALAQAYLGGHGVVRDPREAARWTEASRQGPA